MNMEAILLSFFGSGGVAWIIARLSIKQLIREETEKQFAELHARIDKIQDDYVTCKFCAMQHDNVSAMLKSINAKLDVLIESKIN